LLEIYQRLETVGAVEFDEGDTILFECGTDGLTFSVTVPVVKGEVVT